MVQATAALVLHTHGAREVTREELDRVATPEPTRTWKPIPHGTVIDVVERTLTSAGFSIESAKFGLIRGDARMFSTLTLASPLATGVSLAVGIRSSWDKSFPLGFIAGSRVFVCSNLAFRSDLLVSRKHTVNGRVRFEGAISQAVSTLAVFKEHEGSRIRRLQNFEVTDELAESVMLKAFEQKIVSHRILTRTIGLYREPGFDDFEQMTAWRLLNAFTGALNSRAKSNPQEHARTTMRVNGLIDKTIGIAPFALPAPAPVGSEEGNGHA